VFCYHPGDPEKKRYLFIVKDLDLSITRGELLEAITIRGKCVVVAAADSFPIYDILLDNIVFGVGAYFPLKEIIGKHKIQEDLPF